MGAKYEFKLARVDYTLQTKGGQMGTDSRVDLEVLSNSSGQWKVVSDKWIEPGNTGRLNAGKEESFTRNFSEPILLGFSDSDDWHAYRPMLRLRFRIFGEDKWSPSDIRVTPTIRRRWNLAAGMPYEEMSELWDYDPQNRVLSTDAEEGIRTLTLAGPAWS